MTLANLRVWTACTVVSIGATFAVASPTPTQAPLCSKGYLLGTLGPREVHFLGIARSDTLATGLGDVSYRIDEGHFGRGTDRTMYGQLIDVEQLGTRRPGALRTLRRPVRQVVLVPWDYGDDRSPVPWARTARWVPPSTRGLFSAVLRDPAHWVAGISNARRARARGYPVSVGFRERNAAPNACTREHRR